ncbi:MAG: hypothetical protein ALECFALPRED_008574 [Alectoria fallacina]|uniref:Uncharacterized protein n=1 Tax=Alectoria fallacina TaxID=1903189 RepID=A0A8H3I4M8_9LECA|nr:MAG: hypothetical protein ALECFALPRED_008574 [Alectoria fallacina]
MHRWFALPNWTVRRYVCADQLIDNTDAGDQAVLQCSGHGGDWCCDHNRNASNVCCDSTNSNDFFPLSKGTSVASISTTGPAAATASIIGNPGNADTTSTETTSTSSSSSSTSTTPPSTSTLALALTLSSFTKTAGSDTAIPSPTNLVSIISIVSVLTSVPGGGLSTATSAVLQTTSPTALPASSSSHLGAEIGGGVAGGVALIALIALAFFPLRRRKKRQQYQTAPTTEYRNSMDYMYKANDMGSPKTAETSPEIDGTPIVGVYRGWGPTGGEGALRVVNGSDRQSTVSGLTGANARDSLMSELDSPTTPVRAGVRSQQPTIAEQPYELAGEGEK